MCGVKKVFELKRRRGRERQRGERGGIAAHPCVNVTILAAVPPSLHPLRPRPPLPASSGSISPPLRAGITRAVLGGNNHGPWSPRCLGSAPSSRAWEERRGTPPGSCRASWPPPRRAMARSAGKDAARRAPGCRWCGVWLRLRTPSWTPSPLGSMGPVSAPISVFQCETTLFFKNHFRDFFYFCSWSDLFIVEIWNSGEKK